ncbi:tRNA modification GTPase TrmE [Desarmillaria tabescens]|uniref:tRNA modification GTPase TrmE n=1 Tax=Armillaria tabescens TaxID=1929756 RepID=A0AA39TRG8_ARMTA|nr:tRNA modification GTPase TrmE [Desarmillaria tabescens]KAK0467892.1 tRNA modification GTPase TrmE [Desarmillaria tabescens]
MQLGTRSIKARPSTAKHPFPSGILSLHCRYRTSVHCLVTSHRNVTSVVRSDAQRATIYALSTPHGKAGVGVVRVSGPDALDVWKQMVRRKGSCHQPPEPWKMHRCDIVNPGKGEILDNGLAVLFRAPRSFTTEDVLELHIHSGRAIISSVLRALGELPFCRPAEPGEFTRRAFMGGRLDLTQVEGLKDLIDADTESQRRIALNAVGGSMRERYDNIREEIIKCLAFMEALIDFGEGEDIEDGVYEQARERVLKLCTTIEGHLHDKRRGEIIRSGIRLAIFGPPNAGKSSLLNFLAQREAAIVTPVPGTTRDILELSLDIGGLPVIISDTAGLRATTDLVESIGVERARNAYDLLFRNADISLCVLSLSDIAFNGEKSVLPSSLDELVNENTFYLFNKADLVSPECAKLAQTRNAWVTSLNTGQGTAEFLAQFSEALRSNYDLGDANDSQAPLITHARHRAHLETALEFLKAFLETPSEEVVLGAEELRYAAQAIGKVSGLIDVEDILDSVFRDFCIGK